jgi:MbtH protein
MRDGQRAGLNKIQVVINNERPYSIWPGDRENALGWVEPGESGTKDGCLAYIKERLYRYETIESPEGD